jgi:hypothetical protein
MSDDWDCYLANVNGELASLRVNLGIRHSVPDPLRPHLTWCWVYMNRPRPDGLCSADEAPMLGTTEDDLVGSLKDCATLVGGITAAGHREFYFYGNDRSRSKGVISSTMRRHAAYRFDLGSKRDKPWSQYLDVLYPSPEGYQRIKNRRGVDFLRGHGDPLAKAWPVSHWAYFATPEARGAFLAEVARRGFTIVDGSAYVGKPSARPYSVTLEKVDSIDQIDDVTIELLRLARSHDGEYDGWETAVREAQ